MRSRTPWVSTSALRVRWVPMLSLGEESIDLPTHGGVKYDERYVFDRVIGLREHAQRQKRVE